MTNAFINRFPLSPSVNLICNKHYGGWQAKVNGCDKCPIHSTCAVITPYGEEALRNHVNRLNEHADRVVSE